MNRVDPRVALGRHRTLPATKGHDVLHRRALVFQASGASVAELVGVDMASTDILGR